MNIMMGKLVTYLLCFITLAYFTDVGSGFAKQLYGKIVMQLCREFKYLYQLIYSLLRFVMTNVFLQVPNKRTRL